MREWWIAEFAEAASTRGGGWSRYQCYDSEMKTPGPCICVIEKSAYDDLKQRYEKLKHMYARLEEKYDEIVP
jgi:hypothetical protein